ncbi:MAG: methyl-accepting chemotaxis protein [Spirochaetaceae bacterium]|nr:MAG: methyl-accepting chemotaxis protein [Spirochaetaceae bacterium]
MHEKRGSVSTRILVSVAVAILIIEAIILGFAARTQGQSLLDQYILEARLITAALGPEAHDLQAARDRLAPEGVIAIRRTATGTGGTGAIEEYRETAGGVLVYRDRGLEIEMDISGIPGALRSYALRITGLVAVIVVFVTAGVYLVLRPRLVLPLRRVETRILEISGEEADLTKRISARGNDEIARIAGAFDRFSEKLREIIASIQGRTETILRNASEAAQNSTDAHEHIRSNARTVQQVHHDMEELDRALQGVAAAVASITDSITGLNHSVHRQSDALADSLAAVEELDASIRSLESIAREKKEVTDQLVTLAHEAGSRVEDSVGAIGQVESSTEDMIEMIDIINNVAARTNLLAMNAAIEAAHAGEYGRGFAVVASEIRNLSELSAENATKINRNLKRDISRIHETAEINRTTRDVFDRIVTTVGEVAQAMSAILASLDEQSLASREIVKAVTEIREVTGVVQEKSGNINSDAGSINDTVERLARASRQTSEQMQTVSGRIETINEAMDAVQHSVGENRGNLASLIEELQRFRT